MNQSIQDGLNDLFDQIIPISRDFNKKTYADSFKMHTRSISHFLLRLHRNARIRKTDRKRLKRLRLFCRIECGKYWIRKVQKEKKKMYL